MGIYISLVKTLKPLVCFSIMFFCINGKCNQVKCFPMPNDTISYTALYLEAPYNCNAQGYEFELRNPYSVIDHFLSKNCFRYVSGLFPGKTYHWRYRVLFPAKSKSEWSKWINFEVANIQCLDKNLYNITLSNHLSEKLNPLFFIDGLKSLVDKNFNIIWSLPYAEKEGDKRIDYRDFRMLPNGHISFIHNGEPKEIDLRGNLIWHKTPTDKYYFHHDLKTLANGNKIFLAEKVISQPITKRVTYLDSAFAKYPPIPDSLQSILYDYSCIEEYNLKGEKVWSWCSDSLFNDQDFYCTRKPKNGFPNGNFHSNAFCIDEKTNQIYLGFRDISRIIQIDKATGKATNILPNNNCRHPFFMYQHEMQLIDSNHLLVFSNNACGEVDNGATAKPSSVVCLCLTPQIKKEWEIVCDEEQNTLVHAMGGVDKINDSLLLINLGTNNRTIVKNLKTGKIDWSLNIQYLKDGKIIGEPIRSSYRSHVVSSLYPSYSYVGLDKRSLYIANEANNKQTYFISISDTTGKVVWESNQTVLARSHKTVTLLSKLLLPQYSIAVYATTYYQTLIKNIKL